MAPMRPARITCWFTTVMSIIPLPIVLATAVPMTKAATKLKKAAHRTAFCGERTRVETTVAIELAASWKPFRKSKVSATRMMKMTPASKCKTPSGVLDDDVAEGVGEVLALVAGVLQPLVDLLPLHDLERLLALPAVEQVRDHVEVQRVALVLELGDADDRLADHLLVAEVPDERGGLVDLLHHGHDDLRELPERLRALPDLEQHQELGHPLEVVEDVVEVHRDGPDVLPVERRDEGRVERVEDLLGDLVALVLQGLQLGDLRPPRV